MGLWCLSRAVTIPPVTNDHAVARHGWSAVCAHAWCKETPDLERYEWDCGVSRKFIVPMDEVNHWAVAIVTGDYSRAVTDYITNDLGAVLKSLQGCKHTGVTIDELLNAW